MLVIKLWCLPTSDEEALRTLHKAVVAAVISITELGMKDENDMTVLFPPDMMKYGLGQEIIIEVTRLFNKPELNTVTRQKLSESLGKAVYSLYPSARVECFVNVHNPKQGFWSSAIPNTDPVKRVVDNGNPLVTYADDFVTSQFTEDGFTLLEHDAREMDIRQVNLDDLQYVTVSKRKMCRQGGFKNIFDEVKGQPHIRLGARFLQNVIANDSALKWLFRNNIQKLYLFGSVFRSDHDVNQYILCVYYYKHGKSKGWRWKFVDMGQTMLMGFEYPLLPVKS